MPKKRSKTKPKSVLIIKNRMAFGLFLVLLSNLGWLLPIILTPFLKVDLETKAFIAFVFIVLGQIAYYLGLVIAGKHLLHMLREKKETIRSFWMQFRLFISSIQKEFLDRSAKHWHKIFRRR